MSEQRLKGKRVLVTQADDYMGPATLEVFAEHGAELIADNRDLTETGAVEVLVKEAGVIDVLVANLAAPAKLGIMAHEMDDVNWQRMFDMMVHPLHRLCENSRSRGC